MQSRHGIWREALVSGSLASVLSALALLAAGRAQRRQPAAPVNAISHWIWGDRALHQDEPTLRHTLAGYLIHHLASLFWAALHAAAWHRVPRSQRPLPALAGASVTAGVACFVDMKCTPHRLTPGFEHRLSRPAIAGVYASFALGLALGSWWMGRR